MPTHLISYINSDKPNLRESVYMFVEGEDIEKMLDVRMSSKSRDKYIMIIQLVYKKKFYRG